MSRRPSPIVRLGDRDRAILRDVGRLRFLRGDQVLRLHFPEGTPVGRQRRAQAVLRRLTNDGYLHRLPRRIGGEGSGSGRFVYQLGYRGQREVWPNRRARTPGEAGTVFVEHALAVASVVVELVEATQTGLIARLAVEVEPEAWRHYVAGHGQPAVLKPDLAVTLDTGGQRLAWFIEVDRSTESLARVRTKALQYRDYWRSGREQERIGVFPRVLWSVPDDVRAAALNRTLQGMADPVPAMTAVATTEQSLAALLGLTTNEGGDK